MSSQKQLNKNKGENKTKTTYLKIKRKIETRRHAKEIPKRNTRKWTWNLTVLQCWCFREIWQNIPTNIGSRCYCYEELKETNFKIYKILLQELIFQHVYLPLLLNYHQLHLLRSFQIFSPLPILLLIHHLDTIPRRDFPNFSFRHQHCPI